MSNKRCCLILGLCVLALTSGAWACPGGKSDEAMRHFNPCPAPDDFTLPLPGGLQLAFREVRVAGTKFWGDSRRIVKVGDPGGDIFEGEGKAMIGGAFLPGGASDWHYYLGKYELSKAQFAMIMGGGDLAAGIRRLGELSDDPEDKKLSGLPPDQQKQKLSFPVAWIGWSGIQEFLDKLNQWCLEDAACRAKLPVLKADDEREGALGFIRLPTELEWEYAARGGLLVNEENFNRDLPFKRVDLEKYAVVKGTGAKTLRIGTRDPTVGDFYDLFGNLQELTADLFQAEMGQGKSGALTARGGSWDNGKDKIRSAFRTEVPLYQVSATGKVLKSNSSTGFRVILAAPVLPTSKYRTHIERQRDEYQQLVRNTTPFGMTNVGGTVAAVGNLDEISRQLSELLGKSPTTNTDPQQLQALIEELKSGIRQTTSELGQALEIIDMANQQICQNYLKHTVFFSVLMVRSYRDRLQKTNLIEILSKKQNPSSQDQYNLARLKEAATYEGEQIERYFGRYVEEMTRLAECGDRLAQISLQGYSAEIQRGNLSAAEQEAFNQLVPQFRLFRAQRLAPEAWRDQIIKAFEDKKLLMQL